MTLFRGDVKDCTSGKKASHKTCLSFECYQSVFDASVRSLPISGHNHIHACVYALAEYGTLSCGSHCG